MKRTRNDTLLAGVTGTARVGEHVGDLVAQLQPGDIAILDLDELAAEDADRLVEAEAGAVVLVGDLEDEDWDQLQGADGRPVQLRAGAVHAAGPDGATEVLARGEVVDLAEARARVGRRAAREEAEVTSSDPAVRLRSDLTARPVLVVDTSEHPDLSPVRRLVRESTPALVAIGRAADDLLANGWAPDVVVVTAGGPLPSSDALRVAADVVLVAATTGAADAEEVTDLEGVTPHLLRSDAGERGAALALAQDHGARVVVTVGFGEPATPVVLAAETVEELTGPGGSARQLTAVLLVALVALLVAVAVTPVGHDWFAGLGDTLQGLL